MSVYHCGFCCDVIEPPPPKGEQSWMAVCEGSGKPHKWERYNLLRFGSLTFTGKCVRHTVARLNA